MASRPSPIRRIMAALDASPASRFAVRTAVDLAARFKAELVGLFVEDINLLRAARLPFVREVGAVSPTARRLEVGDVRRELRAQAEQMRRLLALAADLRRVPWDFRVRHGPVAAEVLAAAADADLMIMGRAGRALGGGRRLGSTARLMVLQRAGLTFILTADLRSLAGPVTVLFDGSAASLKALQIAAPLAEETDPRLAVVLVAEDREEARELESTALLGLHGSTLSADFRVRVRPGHKDLIWQVRTVGDGAVLLPCGRERLQGETLCSLVDEIPNPVLLVR
jgi:nucleotide-binding universal stress UspA family protein